MLSKEGIVRYKRCLVEPPASSWCQQKESPSVQSPDPKIDDGAPMEQARPMSHLDCALLKLQAPKSLEAKLVLEKAVRLALYAKSGSLDVLILLALKSYLDLFYMYGFDFSRVDPNDMKRQVLKSFHIVKEFLKRGGNWLSYFKWKNAAFYSYWMGQVSPPLPFEARDGEAWHKPEYLFGGAFYHYQRRLMGDSFYRCSFALSILQSKKGMPRPTDEMVREAEIKSFKTMTSPKAREQYKFTWTHTTYRRSEDPLVPTWVTEGSVKHSPYGLNVKIDCKWVCLQLDRTVREIFLKKNFDCSLQALTRYFLPSSSANYNNSRSKYGGFGALEDADVMKILYEKGSVLPFRLKLTTLTERVSEYYGKKGLDEEALDAFNEVSQEVIGIEFDDSEFLKKWRRFYWTIVRLALKEEPICKVVGLKEALKIRCISKGPPLTYFVLKPFQRLMWGQLQKFWNFELTGTPITEELINKRFGRLGPSWRYHSGDYQGATDELHSWVSNQVSDSFFEVVEETHGIRYGPFSELFKRSLTGHVYHDDELGTAAQERGQLMGSITSFPVLCIANIALVRSAWELAHNRRISLKNLPVWINGDDCLTAYQDITFPSHWRGIGNVMGFKESIGKCYDSAVFCSINSHFFMQDSNARFRLIPYINLGLMEGMDRSTGGAKVQAREKTPLEFGVCQTKLMNGCPEVLRPLANQLFIYKHSKELFSFEGPLFFPSYLGGAGLKSLDPYTRKELDRVTVARMILKNGQDPLPKERLEKDWALYDEFLCIIRRYCPMAAFYPFKRCDKAAGYGQAFFLLMLFSWAQRGIHSLLSKQLKQVQNYSKNLRRFNALVSQFQTMHYTEGWPLRPADAEYVESEKKVEVLPVWTSCS